MYEFGICKNIECGLRMGKLKNYMKLIDSFGNCFFYLDMYLGFRFVFLLGDRDLSFEFCFFLI